MNRPDPHRLEELFDAVLDLPDDRIGAFLDERCAGDAALRAELEAMIAADRHSPREPCAPLSAMNRRLSALGSPEGVVGPRAPPFEVPEPGALVSGKYRIERQLGAGGMGVVMAATHVSLGERVAMKFLRPELWEDGRGARWLVREARAAARLKGIHVARVSDVGQLEGGAPYIVMEHLDGSDLGTIVRERGPLPERDAVELVLQTCAALAEAHGMGIVHCDLKPANLFLAKCGGGAPIVKVLDFGISKGVPRADGHSSLGALLPGPLGGSPRYMAPEQLAGQPVDRRADVWALGQILFELLSGRPAFEDEDVFRLFGRIAHEPAPRLDTARPGIAPGLADVVARCLEKEPAQRFAGVGELALALVPYAPRRARSVAERAVAVSEEAGLLPLRPEGRAPLDSTIGEIDPARVSVPDATVHEAPPPRTMSAPDVSARAAGPLIQRDARESPRRVASEGRPHWVWTRALPILLVAWFAVLIGLFTWR